MLSFGDTGILEISPECVESCAQAEFIENPDFMLDFSPHTNECISSLIATIKKLQANENIWNLFHNEGISSKQIQVWIFYLLHHGLTIDANFEEKKRALYSAHIYFMLLAQPGSSGNQFHHPVLFEKALSSFKIACHISSKSRNKKTKSYQNPDEQIVLNVNQEVSLLDTFSALIKEFHDLLLIHSLKNRPDNLKQSVEALISVVKAFASSSVPTSLDSNDAASATSPNQLSFHGLRSLVNSKHGNVEELSTLVFRLLMTTITMRHALQISASPPRWAVRQAQSAVNLVVLVSNNHTQEVVHSVWKLLQNLIAQCPDRGEIRTHVAGFVTTILNNIPIVWYAKFLDWLKRFANHSKMSYRVGALTVIHQIVTKPERSLSDGEDLDDEARENLSHKELLQVVISAVSDSSPTVRAKALLVLSSTMESTCTPSSAIFEVLHKSLNLVSPNREKIKISIDGVTALEASEGLPLCTPAALISVPVPSLCNFQLLENNLLTLLSDRAYEDKYAVRKNAVTAMESAICHGFIPATKETLAVLEERCRDPLLSIRKAAIQSLTNILNVYPDNANVQHAWMTCLLPSVMDAETSMQEKAVQLVEAKILSNLSATNSSTWNLLLFLTQDTHRQNRVYLQKVTKEWHNQGKLKNNILDLITESTKVNKKKEQSWMLVSIFTLFTGNKLMTSKVLQQWKLERDINNPTSLQMDMISTLGHLAKYMNDDDQLFVLNVLQREIERRKSPIQLIGYYFEAIYKFYESQQPDRSSSEAAMARWCSKQLSSCENELSNVVITQSDKPSTCKKDELINLLHVVGEAAQRCNKVPKRLSLSVQALLTSTSASDNEAFSQPLSQFGKEGIPPSVRAHAIFNLGRMCFRDETLAKKCTPALARELDSSSHEECRSNALVILTDLCILQTQLVDPFLQEMANCLGDRSLIVRKHAVVLLSSLLQREFVKWKDALLFKFLYVACDDCLEVRSLARYFLLDQLLRGVQASGTLFYRNFVACLFYFNNFEQHNVHKIEKSNRENTLFGLSDNFGKRMEIYEFMLTNMEDEHRINLTGKLCTDVLESIVEGTIPLNNHTRNLLTDSLSVLCCKEIRLKCIRSRDENELNDEMATDNPNEQMKVMQNVAHHKAILNVVKMNLVQNIIPIIITLKNKLTELKSPLIKNVMLYLKEVMKEYRKEVNVLLSADKQLASEIQFDLKRFEREEENVQAVPVLSVAVAVQDPQVLNKENSTPRKKLPSTPGASMPSGSAFVTPATVRRKKRPINVQAILKSAQKIVNASPATPAHTSRLGTTDGGTPRNTQQPVRAASTPQSSIVPNLTFAARDLSVINGPADHESVLMLSLPKKVVPNTWNITSPSRLRTPRTVQSKQDKQ